MTLFLSLAVTFFLLAGGVTHHRVNKVSFVLCFLCINAQTKFPASNFTELDY